MENLDKGSIEFGDHFSAQPLHDAIGAQDSIKSAKKRDGYHQGRRLKYLGEKPSGDTMSPMALKHCYQAPRRHSLAHQDYSDAIAIVMLRNPYDWAVAMHKNCW
jgi:hypothetical protein